MKVTAWALADKYREFQLEHLHFANLSRGELSRLERWDDLSADGLAGAREAFLGFAARAAHVTVEQDSDRILAETVAAAAFMDASVGVWWPQLQATSTQSGLLGLLIPALYLQPLVTAEHGTRYLEKLHGFPAMVDQLVERLREGRAAGLVPLSRHVRQTIQKLGQILARPPADDPIADQPPPTEFGPHEAARWRSEVVNAIEAGLRPGLAGFREALGEVTLPSGRPDEEPGLCHLAGGDAVYRDMVRGHTTLDMEPEAIHHLGLERVSLLEDEYRRIAGPLLGTGEVKEIYTQLRDDPQLQYSDPEELVADSLRCLDKAAAAMGGWFDPVPEAPCVAHPIDVGAMAYYYPPSADGVRPGTFFFNVADPTAWARFQIPAVAYHEGIPGHHLQMALAIENPDIHDIHRNYLPAFGEGWGLYTERLSDEMGLYEDDWERIGMLTADSLRAGRLVVDTGIHTLGWSRRKAIRFLAAHSPMSLHEITEEVDRYIATPGQALSYMLGRLEIESLRAESEARLGSAFDIRSFHRTVLGSGSVPLSTLRWLIRGGYGEALSG